MNDTTNPNASNASNDTRKLNKAETVVFNASVEKASALIEAHATIIEARESMIANNEASESIEKLRLNAINAENRAVRADKIKKMSVESPAVFALFAKHHKTPDAIELFYKRAMYTQDKLRAIYRALAAKCSLSAVTNNDTLIIALREVIANKATRKDVIAATVRTERYTSGTAGSQASTSLIALKHIGAIRETEPGNRFTPHEVVDEALCAMLAS